MRWSRLLPVFLVLLAVFPLDAASLLVPMDETQSNHLKAYGLAFRALSAGGRSRWLLNYRGGSFLLPDAAALRRQALIDGVSLEMLDEAAEAALSRTLAAGDHNDLVLEKAPRLVVYAPEDHEPWNDAVTLVLEYAGIPFTRVYDREVLSGALAGYDWLHIHHEDFTGQMGKFHGYYRHAAWYQARKAKLEEEARLAGFSSVAAHKLAVAKTIRSFVVGGGFLFAMCSAPETLDIALAAEGLDIVDAAIDGTPITPGAAERLDYTQTFAFSGFRIITDPNVYARSDIDIDVAAAGLDHLPDSFDLFGFSPRSDPVASMLVQNHANTVKGFLGQVTAFRRPLIKEGITILGHTPGTERVKYLHGTLGKGSFSFLGGHDPEDYRHLVGDPPTNLDLYPNSAGYRLILNNVLFPVAEKKERKT